MRILCKAIIPPCIIAGIAGASDSNQNTKEKGLFDRHSNKMVEERGGDENR